MEFLIAEFSVYLTCPYMADAVSHLDQTGINKIWLAMTSPVTFTKPYILSQLFDSIFSAWSVRNYMLSDASSSKDVVKELWKI